MATVKGSQDPELFVSYREGPQSYAFDLPKGPYAVTLHFAEPELQDLGPRQFQVLLQGQTVLPDFEVKANRDGHGQAALSRTLLTEVAEGEQLVLRLVPLRGLPILSGIEVLPISQSSTLDKGALIWSDEFDDGAESPVQSPSIDRWQYDIWPAGKVNSEDQTYTDRLKNVRVEAGHLVIEAHREALAGAAYTSGRIHTKDRLDVRYGVIEVKAKLPEGQGTWPAIWMLPSDAFKFATTCDASVGEWTQKAIPTACFADAGLSLEQVNTAFVMATAGDLTVDITEIKLATAPAIRSIVSCADLVNDTELLN